LALLLPSDLLGRGIDDISAYVVVNTGVLQLYPLIRSGDLETRAANRTVICAIVMDQWSAIGQVPQISIGSGAAANDWRSLTTVTGPTLPSDLGTATILTFGDTTPVYASSTLALSFNMLVNNFFTGTVRVVAYGWQE
jgi:hypothetical protein